MSERNANRSDPVSAQEAYDLIKVMLPNNSYITEDRNFAGGGAFGFVNPNNNVFVAKDDRFRNEDYYVQATAADLSHPNKQYFVMNSEGNAYINASPSDLSNPKKPKLVKVNHFDDLEHKVNILGNGSHFMSFVKYGDNYILLNTLSGKWKDSVKAEILTKNPSATFSEITNVFPNGSNDCLANSILSWHIMSQCKQKGLSFEEATSLASSLKLNVEFTDAVKGVQDSTATILKEKNPNFRTLQPTEKVSLQNNVQNATKELDNILNGLILAKLQERGKATSQQSPQGTSSRFSEASQQSPQGTPSRLSEAMSGGIEGASQKNAPHTPKIFQTKDEAFRKEETQRRLKAKDEAFRKDATQRRLFAESLIANGVDRIKDKYKSLRSDSLTDKERRSLEKARSNDLAAHFKTKKKTLEGEVTTVLERGLKYMTHFSECRGKESTSGESFPLYGRILLGYMDFKQTNTLNTEHAISSENAVVMSYKMLQAILDKEPDNRKMSHCMDELKRVVQEEYGLGASDLEDLAKGRKDITLRNIDTHALSR